VFTALQILVASSALLPERFLGVAPSATDGPLLQAGFLFSPDDGVIIEVRSALGNTLAKEIADSSTVKMDR